MGIPVGIQTRIPERNAAKSGGWRGLVGALRERERRAAGDGGRAWQDVDWKSHRALVIFRGEFVGRGRNDR